MSATPIAQRVRELKDKSKLTDKEFGKLLGVSDNAVSKWKHNQLMPGEGPVRRMATMAGGDPDEWARQREIEWTRSQYTKNAERLMQLGERQESYVPSNAASPKGPGDCRDIKRKCIEKKLAPHDLPTKEPYFSVASPEPMPLIGNAVLVCTNQKPKQGQLSLIVLERGKTKVMQYDATLCARYHAYHVIAVLPEEGESHE